MPQHCTHRVFFLTSSTSSSRPIWRPFSLARSQDLFLPCLMGPRIPALPLAPSSWPHGHCSPPGPRAPHGPSQTSQCPMTPAKKCPKPHRCLSQQTVWMLPWLAVPCCTTAPVPHCQPQAPHLSIPAQTGSITCLQQPGLQGRSCD